ncbi:ATP-dependent DNA ligase [Streptomyces cyaneofuscatus]
MVTGGTVERWSSPSPWPWPRSAPRLPAGQWYEPKYDGHRMIVWRREDGVRLLSRSGREVTGHWRYLAEAGEALPAPTVLDGETVVWRHGRLDFGAVQSRAASSPRARITDPASYIAFDVLQHPVHGDVRSRPYTARRALLITLLKDIGPRIQATMASDDIEVARRWYEDLVAVGVEGIVAKPDRAYPAGYGWCVDCTNR